MVVFGDPWAALGAFGQPLGLHLSPLGLHWGASEASLGSICRLWGSIGTPSGIIGVTLMVTLPSYSQNLTFENF